VTERVPTHVGVGCGYAMERKVSEAPRDMKSIRWEWTLYVREMDSELDWGFWEERCRFAEEEHYPAPVR
jgi:hypothetical protein